MKTEKDYIGDIAAIRNMMERSSKFLSLSGWAGVMAGIYALAGAWLADRYFGYRPAALLDPAIEVPGALLLLALAILVLALGTAILLSSRRAAARKEKIWNTTSQRMLLQMAIPLLSGGILALIFLSQGLNGALAPVTLLFYGLALVNAGSFTYRAIRLLGIIEIILALFAFYFVPYSMLCWALGFGLMHILTGIYLHYTQKR